MNSQHILSIIFFLFQKNDYSSIVTANAVPLPKKETISKAMKAYLERAQEHDTFMKTQTLEYQIGKRHLANMMGADPETFTQENVDVSLVLNLNNNWKFLFLYFIFISVSHYCIFVHRMP